MDIVDTAERIIDEDIIVFHEEKAEERSRSIEGQEVKLVDIELISTGSFMLTVKDQVNVMGLELIEKMMGRDAQGRKEEIAVGGVTKNGVALPQHEAAFLEFDFQIEIGIGMRGKETKEGAIGTTGEQGDIGTGKGAGREGRPGRRRPGKAAEMIVDGGFGKEQGSADKIGNLEEKRGVIVIGRMMIEPDENILHIASCMAVIQLNAEGRGERRFNIRRIDEDRGIMPGVIIGVVLDGKTACDAGAVAVGEGQFDGVRVKPVGANKMQSEEQ